MHCKCSAMRIKCICTSLHREENASQLIEFAIVLPLLLVVVVGIFDFGQAFTLKQQLNSAAREGARLGSTQPTADLSRTTPDSVVAIRNLVDSYLQTSRIDDCGLNSASLTKPDLTKLQWQASATCPNGNSLTLFIDRSYLIATPNVNVVSTHVNIQYPFQWHFNKVIQLVAPGAGGSTSPVPGDSIVPNMD